MATGRDARFALAGRADVRSRSTAAERPVRHVPRPGGAGRLERQQAQQRHREAGRLVGGKRQVGATLRADLISELRRFRGESAPRSVGDAIRLRRRPARPARPGLRQSDRRSSRARRAPRANACPELASASASASNAAPSRREQRIDDAVQVAAVHGAEHLRAPPAPGLRRRRRRSPGRAATARRASTRAPPRASCGNAAASNGIASASRMCASCSPIGRTRQRLQVELQAARQHGRRHLLRVRGGEHELEVLGRLLERLQHRVERVRTACAPRRSCTPCSGRPRACSARCRASRASRRRRVFEAASSSSTSTKRPASISRQAAQTPHGVAVPPRSAVEALREDARHRGLADAARAGEQVGVMQPAAGERVGQRRAPRALGRPSRRTRAAAICGQGPGNSSESGRGELESSGAIAGFYLCRGRAPAIRHQIGLRRGANRRQRGTYMDVRERWSRRATKYQVDLDDKEQRRRAVPPALAVNRCGCFLPDLTRFTTLQCGATRR